MFSIFTERNKVVTQDLYDSISRAYYCLVDTQANQNMIEHYAGLNMNNFNLLRVTPLMRSHYLTKVVNCMTLILDYG